MRRPKEQVDTIEFKEERKKMTLFSGQITPPLSLQHFPLLYLISSKSDFAR